MTSYCDEIFWQLGFGLTKKFWDMILTECFYSTLTTSMSKDQGNFDLSIHDPFNRWKSYSDILREGARLIQIITWNMAFRNCWQSRREPVSDITALKLSRKASCGGKFWICSECGVRHLWPLPRKEIKLEFGSHMDSKDLDYSVE